MTFTRLPFFRVRVTGLSLTFTDPTTAVPLTAIRQLSTQATVALTLVPFWRAGAMMVARDLTVAPAVVAFVGAWAVVARAGGVPVAGVVEDGGAAVGSGAVADHRNVTALDRALIAVAGVGREADAEAVAVRLALGHVAQRDARQRRQLARVHDAWGRAPR